MKYGFPMVCAVSLERIKFALYRVIDVIRGRFLLWLWGIRTCGRVKIQGHCIFRCHHRGEITLGESVCVNSRFPINLVGLTSPSVMDTIRGGAITIGEGTGLSSPIISSMSSVRIGSRCCIGGNVRIYDHDFHSLDSTVRRVGVCGEGVRSRPIEIGDDCFIGTNAIILKGTRLGARTIVAAGSVVFGLDVPADSMVKGNPAIVIVRNRTKA